MLVRHLHEFIDKLSLTKPAEGYYDLTYLQAFKEKYLMIRPELALSDFDLQWIESILEQRWQYVMDKPDDYTCDSRNTNQLWIQLAKSLADVTGKSYVNLLIPTITNDKELDYLTTITNVSDPAHIFLSENDQTWCSLEALFKRLELDNHNLSTVKSVTEPELRPMTLKELWRIRSKKYVGELSFNQHASFWSYLINDIAPSWSQTNTLYVQLPGSLLTAIDIYLQPESIKKEKKFNNAFAKFVTDLDALPLAEQIYFYGLSIEHNSKKICLLDILLDCLQPENDLKSKLISVTAWLQAKHNKPLSMFDSPRQIFKYFDLFQLHRLLDELPIVISSSYSRKIENMQKKIDKKKLVSKDVVNEFLSIVARPWSEIIDEKDEYAVLISMQYKSFWHYLISRIAPHWQQSGALPTHLVQDLLEIIDFYYQHGDVDNFSDIFNAHLSVFISRIVACPIEDANYFYSLVLAYKGKKSYLLEALIECFQQTDDLNETLASIANLIYEIDPSLVGKSRQLAPVYKYYQAGEFFNINKLNLLLESLEIGASTSLKFGLTRLKEKASKSKIISTVLVRDITKLYAQVWEKIIDTPEDYLRSSGVNNKGWITLARYLAAAGLVHANYYKLLIPTLSHDEDCITLEELTVYPLTSYILSDDGRTLVFLPNSIEHHKVNGAFYNCNHPEAQPFSSKERLRIQHSSRKFADYINYFEAQTDELVVCKQTIAKVFELVNGSLFPEGLSLGNDYTNTKMASAQRAYGNFLEFSAALPEYERNNLYKQRIIFHGKIHSFADVMDQVLKKYGCIAVNGQFFIKLVVDYDPGIKFSKELEIKADIDAMRLCSAKKVYRDYGNISSNEAQRRLLIIFASLMTHSFKYVPFTGISLYAWDSVNTVTLTGKEIFQVLENCLVVNNFEDARFVYALLMENTIKPALVEEGFITSMVRYNDTRVWLQAIDDNSMFDPANSIFFEPALLFAVLWNYVKKNDRFKSLIEPFLDQIIITLAQDYQNHFKWLRINIKFAEFLDTLSEAFSARLLGALRGMTEPVSHSSFIGQMIDFVIHRLASQIARDPAKYYNFFKGNTSINSLEYSLFSKRLKTNMDLLKINEDISIHDLLNKILDLAGHLFGTLQSHILSPYIEKLTEPFPILIGERHCSANSPQVELIF